MAKKFDGVIEAVRYKNGQISFVRAFERRGKTLLERLQKGKVFVTGSREDLLASTFQVSKPVLLVKANEREFISTREGTEHDELENVPLF
jgi:hypothetical protein